ncbi:MAG: c-type cytochrome biogenesis protein CcsB, partial [Burkholderiaceae bacterium]
MPPEDDEPQGYFAKLSRFDWFFAVLLLLGTASAFGLYHQAMDGYEKSILIGVAPAAIALGWFWRPLAKLMIGTAAIALFAIWLYQGPAGADLARAETAFLLKYFLSSQSAVLWMCVLIFMSTAFYWFGMFMQKHSDAMETIGSRMAWVAVVLAVVGTLVRWYEGHQMGPDIGHIPVSNLYEVFILFTWMTTTFYLYYESHYKTRALGPFVMLVVSAAVAFLVWYTVVREAQAIQPLVPALQSWWMK